MTTPATPIKVFVSSTERGPGLLERRIQVRDALQQAGFEAFTNDRKEVSKVLDALAEAEHLKCDWFLIVTVDSVRSLYCRVIGGNRFDTSGTSVASIEDAIVTMRECQLE